MEHHQTYIDLNCDAGESFGAYTLGAEEDVFPWVTSANIACGYHAGDPQVMEKTVELAARMGVAIGAHPGYPDLVGFGRRFLQVKPDELRTMVKYQIGALSVFCRAAGVPLCHVKPHGAMYNQAAKDEQLALAICEGIAEADSSLILLGLAGSRLLSAAKTVGIPHAAECFADRTYREDGTLTPRGTPGAMITDEDAAVRQVLGIVQNGTVVTAGGRTIELHADSVCLHGDNPKAAAFAARLRRELEAAGVCVCPVREVLAAK